MNGILCIQRIMLRKVLSSTFLLTWLTSYDQSVGIVQSAAQGKALRILQRKVKVQQFGEE